jgi:hypothetical protein
MVGGSDPNRTIAAGWPGTPKEEAGEQSPTLRFVVDLPIEVQPYSQDIRRFIDAMVYKLAKNAHKGRWEDLNVQQAFARLEDEVLELENAIKDGGNMIEVMLEAADVGNFALMVAAIIMERGR